MKERVWQETISYSSPFPRQKSNTDVLKMSKAVKLDQKTTLISIPPSVTKSYMKKNPFYFDLKSFANSKRAKSKATDKETSNSARALANSIVFDHKKLEFILNKKKETLISQERSLSPGREVIQSFKKNNFITREDGKELTKKEIIDLIISNSKLLKVTNQKFGKIPE